MRNTILLAVVENERWRPGIGDPTVIGWVTVAAYLVAALACSRAAWSEPHVGGARSTRPATFWLVLAGLMIALGINKQLDLQTLLTQIARDVLKSQQLYAQRRPFQLAFIAFVVFVCITSLAAFLWAARRTLRTRWLATVGIFFILAFVVVRATSFHHVDIFLGSRVVGMKWNWVLELGGISAVALSAVRVVVARQSPVAMSGRPAERRGNNRR